MLRAGKRQKSASRRIASRIQQVTTACTKHHIAAIGSKHCTDNFIGAGCSESARGIASTRENLPNGKLVKRTSYVCPRNVPHAYRIETQRRRQCHCYAVIGAARYSR